MTSDSTDEKGRKLGSGGHYPTAVAALRAAIRDLQLQEEAQSHQPMVRLGEQTPLTASPSLGKCNVSFDNPNNGADGCTFMTESIDPVSQPKWQYGEDETRQSSYLWDGNVHLLAFGTTDIGDLDGGNSPPIPYGRRMDVSRRSILYLDRISSAIEPAPVRDRAMVGEKRPGGG